MVATFVLVGFLIQIAYVNVDGAIDGTKELILSQKDVRTAAFNPNVHTTGLENENDPDADTFTNIGNLDTADYRHDDGYYYFTLVYDGTFELEWKQTSWLTESIITGYTPISVPHQTVSGSKVFKGLGLSDVAGYAYLDGNGGETDWYNAVGTERTLGTGLPGFNNIFRYSTALYTYNKASCDNMVCDDGDECTDDSCDNAQCVHIAKSCDDGNKCTTDSCDVINGCQNIAVTCGPNRECDADDGICKGYCAAFKIDAFLLECSDEFDEHTADITTLKQEISDINDRINNLFPAHSEGSAAHILNNDNIGMNYKDKLIIFLLIVNMLTISGAVLACICMNKKGYKYSKYNNIKAYSSDDQENQHLQS